MSQRRTPRRMAAYWPHLGMAIGVVLNAAALPFHSAYLLATGTNFLTISAAFLLQRRSNRRREEEEGEE